MQGDFEQNEGDDSTFDLREQIADTLNVLPELERQVIELRFGLRDGYPRTKAEVEQRLNVPAARVGELEALALERLR